ncbi:hypothetical protein AKI39_03105 [Bordetella sp. H567]|uniref:hypothetical protein n=1 Tax=Bordetella sp. H567 TaxID=1697043 RepID=UPI00081C6F56|nr:hypothetical protein [Bordetella sp. H567]AOB29894.1 hypothetical protein AKI39_03105 [Bordetella sp. H567]
MQHPSPDQPVLLPTTVWQLSALDRLLTRLICPEGKFDAALILRAADGDKELYAAMLCALINVQTSARRTIDRYDRQSGGMLPLPASHYYGRGRQPH